MKKSPEMTELKRSESEVHLWMTQMTLSLFEIHKNARDDRDVMSVLNEIEVH